MWKRGEIAPLYHTIFNISLTSEVKLHVFFLLILQIWYVEVWMKHFKESLGFWDTVDSRYLDLAYLEAII